MAPSHLNIRAPLSWIQDSGDSADEALPRTAFGRFFRAIATHDFTATDRWQSIVEKNGNQNIENGFLALFLVTLDRRFAEFDLDDVAGFTRRYASFFQGSPNGGWPLETELTIRLALADRHQHELPFQAEHLPLPISHLQLAAALGMVRDMHLPVTELDGLIREAEDLAARRGHPWTPAV